MDRVPQRPLRVAVVGDYEIVTAGVIAVLAPHRDRVEVIDLDAGGPPWAVDIVLFDPFGPARRGDLHSDLAQLSCEGTAKVVAFSWNRKPERIALALNFGAAGYLAKSLSPDEIVAALERVKADETVVEPPDLMPIDAGGSSPAHPWGLSPREAQVIALVARGLTNQQIADHVHLSINSIKTHTKNAYRKIGMSRRSQVVAWALAHGLTAPEISGAPGHIGVGGASHRIH